MNRDVYLRLVSPRGQPRATQRGVTTLLVLVVLASLILGGTVGAWMRVVSTRTSGQAISTSRGIACAEAGLAAGRAALFTGAAANAVFVSGVALGGLTRWQSILATTWDPVGRINRPFLRGKTALAPVGFTGKPLNWDDSRADFKPQVPPPAPLTFEVTLANNININNPIEYPARGGAAINPASPTLDRDGLFIISAVCYDSTDPNANPSIPYPIVVSRYLRHPDTKSPPSNNGGSTQAP